MIVVAMTLAAAGYLFFSASQIAQNDLARPDPTPFQDQLLSKIAEVEALDTVIVPSTILDRIERLRDSSRDFADLVPEAGLRRSYSSLFYDRGDESEIDFNSSLQGDGRRNNYLIGLLAPLISIADPAPFHQT